MPRKKVILNARMRQRLERKERLEAGQLPFSEMVLPFRQARSLARRERLESREAFVAWVMTGNAPWNMPLFPERVYADDGWHGWENFLYPRRNRDHSSAPRWLPYEESRQWAIEQGITSITQWQTAVLPPLVPRAPWMVYKGKGWEGWPPFFGRERLPPGGRKKSDLPQKVKSRRPVQPKRDPRQRKQRVHAEPWSGPPMACVDVFFLTESGGCWKPTRAWADMPIKWARNFCRVMSQRESGVGKWSVRDEAGEEIFYLIRSESGDRYEWTKPMEAE